MITGFIKRFVECVRYPVSSPHDVLSALGVQEDARDLNFHQFLKKIITRAPKRLCRWMTRDEVEKCFSSAYKKECFHHTTLVSYYFLQGWLEFILEFDQSKSLRRLYVQHPLLNSSQSIELELPDHIGEGDQMEICSQLSKQAPGGITSRILQKFVITRR